MRATEKTESNSKVRTYYKWKETDKMIYNEAINSVEYQVQLSDIKNNLSTSETDINDTVQIIQKVILEAAAPSKTTTCIGKFYAKLQASPWYDYECKAQRQTYNRLRNKYNKSKTDNDKDSRDEAKKVYIRMCKSKAAAYDKEETNIFLECKFTDPRKYWQHIKPRTSQCDTNVTPALFAEHFSKLYSSKHILRNVS